MDLGRIVRTAREMADFDVICLQEVADNFPGLEGNDDQFAELAALLPGYQRIEGFGLDKADGALAAFFERPIAGTLGVFTLLVWLTPLWLRLMRNRRR